MTEDLQSLLERIQKDGVEKAQAEAERILAEARSRADLIVKDAEERGRDIVRRAGQDGEAFARHGRQTVEQAARDAVLSVGQAIQATFRALVLAEVTHALTPETVQTMLLRFVDAYIRGGREVRMEVVCSPEDRARLTEFFAAKYAEQLRHGLRIEGDGGLTAGFRVRVGEDQVEHDFSAEAITDALCQLLRPHIADIVRQAAGKTQTPR